MSFDSCPLANVNYFILILITSINSWITVTQHLVIVSIGIYADNRMATKELKRPNWPERGVLQFQEALIEKTEAIQRESLLVVRKHVKEPCIELTQLPQV